MPAPLKTHPSLLHSTLLLTASVVIFLAVTGITSQVLSHLTATAYPKNAIPESYFPIVAAMPENRATQPTPYELLRWSEIEKTKQAHPEMTFWLPASKDSFVLPMERDFKPYASFNVLETKNSQQLIEIEWHDESKTLYAKYRTNGTLIWPLYLRIWNAGSVMISIIPGFGAGWYFERVIRRRWSKK